MPFDLGFNFRGSAGYVTDGAEGVPALGESYPHTYTNGNGDSINGGWVGLAGIGVQDLGATNDPRIAGYNYSQNSPSDRSFQVALDSGSAPGAGDYSVDFAAGNSFTTRIHSALIKDNTTTLIDLSNGGSGYSRATNHYLDATAADVTATTTWTGTPASVTFSTTTALVRISLSNDGDYTTLAHFRLTLQGAAQSVVPLAMHSYRQRRA